MPNAQPTKPRRGRPPGARNKRSLAAQPRPAIEPLAVRPAEAAAAVGVGLSTMKAMIADGRVTSIKMGAMRLVLVSSLRRLVGE